MKPRLPKSERGPNHKLVLIEWVDSWSSRGWTDSTTLSQTGKTIFTVGWVIHESAEVLQIAGSAGLNETEGFDEVHGTMTIPRVSVIRVKVLSTKRL